MSGTKFEFSIYRDDGNEIEFSCSALLYPGSPRTWDDPGSPSEADGFEVRLAGKLLTEEEKKKWNITDKELEAEAFDTAERWVQENYCDGCKRAPCGCP